MKTEFKGTPGPWSVGKIYGMDNMNDCLPIESKDNEICRITAGLSFDEEETANAHLIAASPLLLEKLIQLADRYKSLVDSGDCGFWEAEDEPEYKEAINAINKALIL